MTATQFLKKLTTHKTVRNIGYLTFGNVLSQIIALVGAFYIPRLLGPEQYGIYNTVAAYVGLFGVFTFGGLTKVITREVAKDTSKAKGILEATIGLRNFFSIFAALLSIAVVLFINYDFGTKAYIFVFSFTLLFQGTHSSLDTIFLSHQRMKVLSVVTIVKQLLRVPLSILFLILGYGVISLIVIQLCLEFLVTLFLYKKSQRIVKFKYFSQLKFIKEYILSGARFSLLQFLNLLSGKIDLVMLSFLTTPENVGIYAFAYRLVKQGLIINGPVSQSLFPYYANKYNSYKPKLKELVQHTLLIFIPLALFLFPIYILIDPIIINVVGQEFIESSGIFKILIFYVIFNFCNIPLGLYLQSTNQEKYSIYVGVIKAILNVTLNLIFFYSYGIIGVAYSTLIVEATNYLLKILIIKKLIQ